MPAPSNHHTMRKAQRHPLSPQDDYVRSRSRILRELGRCGASNGAQFAILWVSPDGDTTECFASEALCGKLSTWFSRDAQGEAKECMRRMKQEREARTRQGLQVFPKDQIFEPQGRLFVPERDDDESDEEMEGGDVPSELPGRLTNDGGNYDEFLPTPSRGAGASTTMPSVFASPGSLSSSTNSRITRSNASTTLFPSSTSSPNPSPAASGTSITSPAAVNSPFAPSPAAATNAAVSPLPPHAFPPPAASSRPSSSPSGTYHFTPGSVTEWYESRFGELQHKADKLLCKVWIKATEPAKATKFPYQRGDDSKPPWWPEGVRHKEPDHLTKAERHTILLHLIRHSPVSVDELEKGVDSMLGSVPEEKVLSMRNVLKVAREERNVIQRHGGNTFRTFSVSLGATTPPKIEEDDDEGRLHNTRHRTRNSIGKIEGLDPSSAQQQQTPRGSARASPYPLSRSHSISDGISAQNSPVRSPMLGSSVPASASMGMSRSQSLAGPISSSGKPRNARRNGRSSLGEADLLDSPNGAFVLGAEFQQSLITTPYSTKTGARPSITPRQGQGSPLAAGMSRSYSTSALGGPSVGASGALESATKKKLSLIDDSVASPAMIKSRSRLSQQHFDQMGLGGKGGAKGRPQQPPSSQQRGPPQQAQYRPDVPPFAQQQQPQQLPHPPQRPPLLHAHTQPIPQSHFPQHQHAPILMQQQHSGQQHVLVYPQGLGRPHSNHGQPIHIHPAHQFHPQHHAPQSQGHHPHNTQVQVQVQVHAASLPPHEYDQHQQHQQHQQLQYLQNQNGSNGGYPTPSTATFASPHFGSASPNPGGSPFLGQSQNGIYDQHRQQPSHQHQQQQQQSHEAFLIPQSQQFGNGGGAENALYAGSGNGGGGGSAGASPLCGMGEYLADHSSTASSTPAPSGQHQNGFFGASPLPLPQDGSNGGGGGGGDDLTAYMRELETLETLHHGGGAQQQQGGLQEFQSYDDPSSLGLGLGLGGGGGGAGDALMSLDSGYYA